MDTLSRGERQVRALEALADAWAASGSLRGDWCA